MSLQFCKKILSAVFTFSIIVTLSNYTYAEPIQVQPQKNILILNSYNESTAWTSNQDMGIIETIEEAKDNSGIYIEYIDWKNYASSNNLSYLYDYYKYKYKDKHLDLIITTDDSAFTFALKNRIDLFSNAPIVFSGVNQESLSQVEGKYKNFTGVIEVIDPTDTIKMALAINPAIQNVYVVFDNSESGISTGKLIIDKIKALNMNLNTIQLNNLTFNELLEVVSNLNNKSIVFFATYYSDVAGNIIDFNLASREISKYSSVPLYHQYDFGLNKGAFGGNMMSGRLSGNYAAKLALHILNGEEADSIPISSPKITRKVFDYQQLKRFNIPLNKVPKDAEIINKPFSFIETYKPFVLGVLLTFIIMLIFLLTLLMYIRKIRNIKKQLSNGHEELTQTYEELVATDEELKHQMDEIKEIQKNLYDSEEKYTYLALHDVLTGLPNRRSLFEDAKEFFSTKTVNKAALLFIDMDNFKYINDTMGHEFGDELIKQASERLSLDLDEKSILYRLGGDEFIILKEEITQSDAEKIISNILYSFKEGFIIRNSVLHISFSIGLAMYPEHGEDIEELIKAAD
ncbi:MAG: ABC transporter substrate-binding protein, partial [Ruminiclostridium sp.]